MVEFFERATHPPQVVRTAPISPKYAHQPCTYVNLDDWAKNTDPSILSFYEEAKLHYRYVWDGLDEHERSTVLRVSRGKGLPDSLQHVLSELQRRHYVEERQGRPALFSSTFDEFVKSEAAREEKTPLFKRLFGAKA